MNLFLTNLLRPAPIVLALGGIGLSAVLSAILPALLGVGAAALAAGAGALNPARRLAHRLAHAPGVDRRILDDVTSLAGRLRALRSQPGAGQEAFRALEQLDSCHAGYLGFADVLGERFERGELTYGRYLEAARQVYLGSLDALGRAATSLESIGRVDGPRLRAELRQLERKETDDETALRRREGLREQIAALDAGAAEAMARLADNDAALGELAAAAGALARIETRRRLADAAQVDTMAELRVLADRAELYALPGTTPARSVKPEPIEVQK